MALQSAYPVVHNYQKYAFTRTETNAEALWESLLAYDFSDYEIVCQELKKIWAAAPFFLSNKFFTSNGTTNNTPKKYAVGPLTEFWLQKMEWFIKFRSLSKQPCVYIQEGFPHFLTPKVAFAEKKGLITDAFLTLDFREVNKSFSLLKETINQYYEKHGKFYFLAQPPKYLYLFTQPEFKNLLIEQQNKFTIVTSDWEPLFPKPFLVNDQMINWVTMVNFYTCEHNTKHFLPTFIIGDRLINLLNFATKKEWLIDDQVALGERQLCACGKYYLPFKMTAHIACAMDMPHDVSIAEELRSTYYNLQFIQTEYNKVDILYSTDGVFKDEEYLRETYNNTTFQVGRYLPAGTNKILPFCYNRAKLSYCYHEQICINNV
jgi:hypothetical protein